MTFTADIGIRLVLSCILGGLIGYERQSRNKSAGLRTHILVCLGSCLIMLTGTNLFYNFHTLVNVDPGRLAAQVVSGIGFLGAGTILRDGPSVQGLTTAASLWVVSGVGLAVGGGYLFSAGITTVLAFITLAALTRIEKTFSQGCVANIAIRTLAMPGQMHKINTCLSQAGAVIRDIKIVRNPDHTVDIAMLAYFNHKDAANQVTAALLAIGGITSVQQGVA